MRNKVVVVLADGFEEIEAITVIDLLRRAGQEVTVAGVGKTPVRSAHRVQVIADKELEQIDFIPDAIILPGGMPGSENLAKSTPLMKLLNRMKQENKWICAICAAPALVLAPQALLHGKRATCYPGFEDRFPKEAVFVAERVVVDGKFITSRGPGTAIEFALEIVKQLAGEKQAMKLSEAILACQTERVS